MAERKPRVVGLDLSLTSSGMSDGYEHRTITTMPDEELEARLDRIVRSVVGFTIGYAERPVEASLAVIEAGAFSRGAQSHSAEVLSGLRLMVRHRLWRLHVPFAMVSPTTLKKYVTGNGSASKDDMVAALDVGYGTAFAAFRKSDGRYDRADAFALAAMGYNRVGQPLPVYGDSAAHRASLDAVKWPDLLSDD